MCEWCEASRVKLLINLSHALKPEASGSAPCASSYNLARLEALSMRR